MFATSTVLAVAQPGDLGDDDTDTDETAQDTTTSTTSAAGETTTSVAGSSTTAAPITTVTTAAPITTTTTVGTTSTTAAAGTTSTTVGSGLGGVGSGDVRDPEDGTAETGMESMLLPGVALLGLGLALRRATRTDTA